jgi:hypothetical protein
MTVEEALLSARTTTGEARVALNKPAETKNLKDVFI